jgi:hypothetical protein
MRTIEWTSAFRRDYKRVKSTPRHKDIETLLPEIADRLVDDCRSRKSTATIDWVGIGKTIASAT